MTSTAKKSTLGLAALATAALVVWQAPSAVADHGADDTTGTSTHHVRHGGDDLGDDHPGRHHHGHHHGDHGGHHDAGDADDHAGDHHGDDDHGDDD